MYIVIRYVSIAACDCDCHFFHLRAPERLSRTLRYVYDERIITGALCHSRSFYSSSVSLSFFLSLFFYAAPTCFQRDR